MNKAEQGWTKRAAEMLVGKRVKAVSWMTEGEANECGYGSRPVVIEFEDGTAIWPQSDDEGNDGGALAVTNDKTPVLPVMR